MDAAPCARAVNCRAARGSRRGDREARCRSASSRRSSRRRAPAWRDAARRIGGYGFCSGFGYDQTCRSSRNCRGTRPPPVSRCASSPRCARGAASSALKAVPWSSISSAFQTAADAEEKAAAREGSRTATSLAAMIGSRSMTRQMPVANLIVASPGRRHQRDQGIVRVPVLLRQVASGRKGRRAAHGDVRVLREPDRLEAALLAHGRIGGRSVSSVGKIVTPIFMCRLQYPGPAAVARPDGSSVPPVAGIAEGPRRRSLAGPAVLHVHAHVLATPAHDPIPAAAAVDVVAAPAAVHDVVARAREDDVVAAAAPDTDRGPPCPG